MQARSDLTYRPYQLYNVHMKIKKTLKGLGLWTSKSDVREQAWFLLCTVAICLLAIAIISFWHVT